jgi:quinol monooxygenase YgiN
MTAGAMTWEQVDRALTELAATVSAIRLDHESAEQAADVAERAAEALREEVGVLGVEPARVRPRYALLVHQEEAARSTELHLRAAYEELAAWYAHAATLAMQSILRGTPVTEAAMAATGPWHFLSPDDHAELVRRDGLPDKPLEPEEWRHILWDTA